MTVFEINSNWAFNLSHGFQIFCIWVNSHWTTPTVQLHFTLEAADIINCRQNRLEQVNRISHDDPAHVYTWHISTGINFCEVSFYIMDKINNPEPHNQIQKLLRDYPLEQKTNITFALVKFIPFTKPDILFHVNHNPAEIAHCLISHHLHFLSDLNSILDNITVNIDRIYKFSVPDSKLVGKPFPEVETLRLRINLKTNSG